VQHYAECKCTAEKCDESCKCKLPGKCGCNTSKEAEAPGGSCCKKSGCDNGKSEKDCCGDTK
ncbi:hypothetical protein KR093_000839, partial [Drosophila rubida]